MSRLESPQEPAAPENIRLLFIEDSEQDLELTLRQLRAAGLAFRHRCVMTEQQMRDALASEMPQLILADFTLPAFDGSAALSVAREQAPDVPFIFLSGTIGEERAVEALKSGATDYMLKSNPARLVAAVRRALAEADSRRRGRHAERQAARLTRVLHMHSGINAALVRIRDRNELLTETCRLAHHVGGYAVAMVALIDPVMRIAQARKLGWIRFSASRGYCVPGGRQRSRRCEPHGPRHPHRRSGPLRRHRAPDVSDPASRSLLIAGGVRSLACLPLRVDGTPIGSFLCGAMATGVISRDELVHAEQRWRRTFHSHCSTWRSRRQCSSSPISNRSLASQSGRCSASGWIDCCHAASSRLPRLAVTVFDIEHLRVINDSYGRHTGDRLLQCVADRLRAQFPDTEQLAHLGGGTFVCLAALPERDDPDTAPVHRDVTPSLIDRSRSTTHDILLKIKSGVACFPDDGQRTRQAGAERRGRTEGSEARGRAAISTTA